MNSRCHICQRRLDHDHDPFQPKGHYDREHYEVAMRNGILVVACHSCWFKWPDAHKTWPEVGFGVGRFPVDALCRLLAATDPATARHGSMPSAKENA